MHTQPSNMKALMYLGIGELKLQEVKAPEGEFIVKVLGSGICGTDLKCYLKGHHMFKPPTILGHELYGNVCKAPENCGFKLGDIVVVAPYVECGQCKICKTSPGELCKSKSYIDSGAFCEYISIPLDYLDKGVFKVEDEDDVYTLVEPLACVLNGIEHLKINPFSKVLVVGSGPMGALFALTFKARGIPVAVVEPSEIRRNLVSSWGIECFEPDKFDASGFDNVVVAVNKAELIDEYVRKVEDEGTVLVFSGLRKEESLNLDSYSIHYREITVTGSFGYAMKHFREALELIKCHKDVFSKVITHKFPLEKGKEAFDMLKDAEALKVILKP